ncbi:MAG TPA: hypothetical protein VG077_07990, partial [Verrucomicrobiae bacterium]|nr:hypothetical protein [Verrucomicrobiae bacterium]
MSTTLERQSSTPAEDPLQNESRSWLEPFTAGRLAGLIALFLFALYPGVMLGTHSFFFRDYGLFTYPVAWYAHQSFWQGQVPLWNPLDNCGVPFLAQWNTSVCYPPSLIYMVFPLPWSLNFFCLGHLLFAGVSMYLLAYRWTQNRLAASIAGLVFALNGLMLNSLMWTSNLAALSWQPLVVLWTEQAWRQGGPRRIAIAALAGAMQMLAGAPEIIVFTWTMLGVLWLGQAWRKTIPLRLTLRRFIIVVALIAGLSAVQFLPFFDLLKHSDRSNSYVLANKSPMPLWGWANFVLPVFHCIHSAFGPWLQLNQVWTSGYYCGIGTLVLMTLALRRRQPMACGLMVFTFAGLVLALGDGGYVYAWLRHIVPWIGFARYPIKFVSIPVFTIPLLAAYGFQHFQSGPPESAKREERRLFLAGILGLLLLLLVLAAAWSVHSAFYPWHAVWREGALRALFLVGTVAAVGALKRLPPLRVRGFVGLAVLALIGFDLVTSGLGANPTVVTKAFGPLELNMTSRPRLGESRAMVSQQVASYLDFVGTRNPLYYFVGLRGALFENCNIPENIPKVDGFCSLYLKDETDIGGIFYGVFLDKPQTNAPPAALLDFLGVSQISPTNSIFSWEARTNFLPWATAGQRPVFASDADTMKKLESADFDPRHTVYLPLSARRQVTVTNVSKAKIAFQEFGAQKIHLTVEAPAPALVVVAQAFYH